MYTRCPCNGILEEVLPGLGDRDRVCRCRQCRRLILVEAESALQVISPAQRVEPTLAEQPIALQSQ
jgi:hypothetical protein